MLQMLNVDNRRSNNETLHNHSDQEVSDDDKHSHVINSKRDKGLVLPMVRPHGNKLNMSDGNIMEGNELPNIEDDHLRPKV
jgi:hypothetical protein